MPSHPPIIRLLIIAAIFLILLVGGVIAAWELIFSEPDTPMTGSAAVTTRPAEPVTGGIGGTVQDETKKPISGVKVRVEWEDKQADPKSRTRWHNKTVSTNDHGNWILPGVPGENVGSVSLSLTHRDYSRKDVYQAPLAALADHSLVTILSRGLDISGEVVDSAGNGISGATVTTKRSRYDDSGVTVRTEPDGHFVLHHIPAGYVNIVVTAKNYAAGQLHPTTKDPVKIVLTAGQTLHGQVIDKANHPLKGVSVSLERFGSAYQAIDLHATTDADGKFAIAHVPSENVTFDVGKSGFQDIDLTVNPGDPPPTVTLVPTVVFGGKVVDADTGKPIAKFDAFPGALWPGWTGAIFDRSSRPEHTFYDGAYNLQASGFGGTILAWYVRIEADGYYPQTGNPVRDGGKAPQDFRLHRGPDLRGTLTDIDGKPVPNTRIILLIPCAGANVYNGEFEGPDLASDIVTDAQGAFHTRPQTGPIELWAMGKTGIAETRLVDSDATPVAMKLQSFASVRVHSATTIPSSPDQEARLSVTPGPEPNDPLNFSHWSFPGVTQPNGDILFDRLPAVGDGLTSAFMYVSNSISRSMAIHLAPGKTTVIDTTGGITLSGQFVPDRPENRSHENTMQLELHRIPDGSPNQWPANWAGASTADVCTYGYSTSVGQDGKFSVTGVSPGKYEYSSFINWGALNLSVGTIDIPDVAGGRGTFDAGQLVYSKYAPLSAGDTAPAILGRTLADQPIRLSDFSGKYVVWFFWGEMFSGVHPGDPELAALLKQFGGDSRVALVAINSDRAWGNDRPPTAPGVLPDKAWTNGYVSMTDLPMLTTLNFFKDGDYPRFFIISPDGKIAAMNIAPDKIPAALTEMLSKSR